MRGYWKEKGERFWNDDDADKNEKIQIKWLLASDTCSAPYITYIINNIAIFR